MPQFSILMANYNKSAYLDEAIQSVLAQTFTDWELVVIDDASTDGSVTRIRKYLTDTRIRLHVMAQNAGYTKALIAGVAKTSCEVIGLLDSDDKLATNAIERAFAIHSERKDVGLVLSQVVYCDAELNVLETTVVKPEHINEPMVWMAGPTAFRSFKRSAYERTAGLDISIKHAEDWDLVFKLEEVAPVYRLDEPLYYYRVLDTSISNSPRTHMIGQRSTVLAQYNAYRRRPRGRSYIPRPFLVAGMVAAVRYSIELDEPRQAFIFALRVLLVAPLQEASWRALWSAVRARSARRPRDYMGAKDNVLGPTVLRSYAARNLQSNTGNRQPDRVVCIPLVHRRGHCIYGGDHPVSESAWYEAVFELDIKPYEFAVDPVVVLDVYENRMSPAVLAERAINVSDLAQGERYFAVRFFATPGQRVEFRAYWLEQCDLYAYGVVLTLTGKNAAAPSDDVSKPSLA